MAEDPSDPIDAFHETVAFLETIWVTFWSSAATEPPAPKMETKTMPEPAPRPRCEAFVRTRQLPFGNHCDGGIAVAGFGAGTELLISENG